MSDVRCQKCKTLIINGLVNIIVKRKVKKESDYGTKDIYSYGGRIAP